MSSTIPSVVLVKVFSTMANPLWPCSVGRLEMGVSSTIPSVVLVKVFSTMATPLSVVLNVKFTYNAVAEYVVVRLACAAIVF